MPAPLPHAVPTFTHGTQMIPLQEIPYDMRFTTSFLTNINVSSFEKTGFFELLLLNIVDVDALRQTTVGIIDPRDVFLIKTHQAFAFERGPSYFENDTYMFLNKILAQPAAFSQSVRKIIVFVIHFCSICNY
jgi:hypothetical protein